MGEASQNPEIPGGARPSGEPGKPVNPHGESGGPQERRQQDDHGVEAAARGAGAAGERREQRMFDNPEDKRIFDEESEEDLLEVSQLLRPGTDLTDEQRKAHISALAEMYNKISDPDPNASVSDTDLETFATRLGEIGFRQGETENEKLIDEEVLSIFPNLTPDQLQTIKQKLPKITQTERDERARAEEEMPDDVVDEMPETAQEMGKKLDELGRELDTQIEAETDPAMKQRMLSVKDRIANMSSRFTDTFKKGETGRNIARKVGKSLWYITITMFLLIVFEMNLINKMSRRQR